MKSSILLTSLLCLLIGACGEDQRGVSARLPTPPDIERLSLSKINNNLNGLDSSINDKVKLSNYINNDAVVAKTSNEVKGLSLQLISQNGNNGPFVVEIKMQENLTKGCYYGTYRSASVTNQMLSGWVSINNGDFKVSCVDKNCGYILVVLDRLSPEDINNVYGPKIPQAGAVVMMRDQNTSEALDYIPTLSGDKMFLNTVGVHFSGAQQCTDKGLNPTSSPLDPIMDYTYDGNTNYQYFPPNNF